MVLNDLPQELQDRIFHLTAAEAKGMTDILRDHSLDEDFNPVALVTAYLDSIGK